MVPDEVHLPGIYVHRIVHNPTPKSALKSAPFLKKRSLICRGPKTRWRRVPHRNSKTVFT